MPPGRTPLTNGSVGRMPLPNLTLCMVNHTQQNLTKKHKASHSGTVPFAWWCGQWNADFSSHLSRTFKTLLLIVGEWPEPFFLSGMTALGRASNFAWRRLIDDRRRPWWPAIAVAETLSSRPAIILTLSAVESLLTPLMLFCPAVWENKFRSEKKLWHHDLLRRPYVLVVKKTSRKQLFRGDDIKI